MYNIVKILSPLYEVDQGGGGGGQLSIIDKSLSPEPKTEGSCNFIYLGKKGSCNLLAELQLTIVKRNRVIIKYIGVEIQILHFITLFI